jgi:hypothetical protein
MSKRAPAAMVAPSTGTILSEVWACALMDVRTAAATRMRRIGKFYRFAID